MAKKQVKILYIEDDSETRSLMADIMRFRGYVFYEASRGLDGIRIAKDILPDLIIVDLILPDMQGYEISTLLKSLPELKNVPIIALTAEIRKNVKELTLAAGCDGFINKPINVNEFLFKVEEYISGRRDRLSDEEKRVYLEKYNIQLVEKLTRKFIELESANENLSIVNKELTESREELARYNDRLFYLNNLANELRKKDNPVDILHSLPQKVVQGFKLNRCCIFEINTSNATICPAFHAGFRKTDFEKKNIKISPSLLTDIKGEGGLLWLRNFTDVAEKGLEKLSEMTENSNFIIANLTDLSARNDSTSIIRALNTTDPATFKQSKFLIYIDKHADSVLETYEVRIIKSFIQTIGAIYENMFLYYQLLETYKIKEIQAITDGLTKVYNYRFLMQEIEREINRSNRYGNPFSLVMLDIDNFKTYNDENGHLAGDDLLKIVSELIKNNLRNTDIVARYGGEEFVIILPGLPKDKALLIAKKLQQLVEETRVPFQNKQPSGNLTISLGVASFPQDTTNLTELLQKVDAALYRAKKKGRNQVSV